MALMLIFADGVKDVLDLVTRLRTSGSLLTPDRISEFLWAVATLLLAMKNANITITNRSKQHKVKPSKLISDTLV